MTAARDHAALVCPDCHQPWTTEHWIEANRQSRLVHHGQSIDREGRLQGDPPATDTLGFRGSAANNLLYPTSELAADDWKAAHSSDEENAERAMRQFVWCVPIVPTKWEETSLDAHELTSRMVDLPRGIVPNTAQHLTAGVDLGKYVAHWIVVAWSEKAAGHIVDYGRLDVASDDLGVERAILTA